MPALSSPVALHAVITKTRDVTNGDNVVIMNILNLQWYGQKPYSWLADRRGYNQSHFLKLRYELAPWQRKTRTGFKSRFVCQIQRVVKQMGLAICTATCITRLTHFTIHRILYLLIWHYSITVVDEKNLWASKSYSCYKYTGIHMRSLLHKNGYGVCVRINQYICMYLYTLYGSAARKLSTIPFEVWISQSSSSLTFKVPMFNVILHR